MIVRKTTPRDVPFMAAIFDEAREYMRQNGINQWQQGYPNGETVLQDICDGISYVYVDESDAVFAGAMMMFDRPEPTYAQIFEGSWLTENAPYATIHRIAVKSSAKGGGIAGRLMHELEQIIKEAGVNSVRIDTHRDNLSMQRNLAKNGYRYCGIIYLENGDERLAYEKLL